MGRVWQPLIRFMILSALCYAFFLIISQRDNFFKFIDSVSFGMIVVLLLFAFLNYALRFLRWHLYLKAMQVPIEYAKSFKVFMAGLSMTVTPGKAGEVFKSNFLHDETSSPWITGVSVVFVERLMDLVGVVLLVLLGTLFFPVGKGIAVVGLLICFTILLVFTSPRLFVPLINLTARIKRLSTAKDKTLDIYNNIRNLLSWRLFILTTLLSVVAWFSECLVLYFALIACGCKLSIVHATFVYSLSTLAGALSMIPGGLIATEGSMTGLLFLFGIAFDQGTLVTLIVRICTLWFAVLLGALFLMLLVRDGRQRKGEARDTIGKQCSG